MGSDGIMALSPKPLKLVHQYDTLLTPVKYSVWLFLLISLFIATVGLYSISNQEETILKHISLRHWSQIGQATWYAFSTLIGESVTRDLKSESAWALR